jgi:ATP-binding cassette subfamily B protein/subfamily B ATP-binding cassette protein MsbA
MNKFRNSLKPISFLKKFIFSRVKSPAYRVILTVANYNRGLLLLTFNSNLLAAIFEGSTFGIIYVALRVLEEGSLANIQQLKWLASYVAGWGQGQLFIGLIVLAIIMQFLRSGLSYVGLVSAGYLKARIRTQMMSQVFQQIMLFSFPCASSYKVGDLTQYLQDAQGAVDREITQWNKLLIKAFIVVSYVVVLIGISPALAIISMLLAFGLLALQKYLIPHVKQTSRQFTKKIVIVNKSIVESIQGLRLIHSFGRQKRVISEINQLTKRLVPIMQRQERFVNITQPISQALVVSVVGTLLVLGFVILNSRQSLVIPALFTFIAALNRLSSQLGSFASVFNILANNAGRMDRLSEVLQINDKEFARFGGKIFEGLIAKIQFENVTLQYLADQAPALQNVDFVMPKGSVTALVGGSGAGKSSIADLLTGLYDPTEGRITIDGVDLQAYSLASWRAHLGVVSQDTFIFNQPILDNIRYGKPEAMEVEVIEAAKAAHAHEFIEALPQGYQTVVGERGYRLSGGQRQRLALARAILKQPEVLILDEATSALDSQSERLVQEALAMFKQDRTVLVIAHRLSTITGADLILVLDQGKIVEQGTHQELLRQGERYANYWQLQAQGQVGVT